MKTKLISLSEASLTLAAAFLKNGEPVVFPTETVYGLGAPIYDEKAIKKIFTIKKRPVDNPLIVHVASWEEALSLCVDPPPAFQVLAHRFWPGPLTIVLQRHEQVFPIISAGRPTIAIRMPSHPGALSLIQKTGEPLAAPSANLSGRPSPTSALDAWEDLKGKTVLILDGGACPIGIESTVISLIESNPVLLRPGSISAKEIEETLQMKLRQRTPNTKIDSPGMKYRHYAPQAKIRLVFRREELCGAFILSPNPQKGERLLTTQSLYAQFREADRLRESLIEIDCTPQLLSNEALMNRILKAANIHSLY